MMRITAIKVMIAVLLAASLFLSGPARAQKAEILYTHYEELLNK